MDYAGTGARHCAQSAYIRTHGAYDWVSGKLTGFAVSWRRSLSIGEMEDGIEDAAWWAGGYEHELHFHQF